MKAAADVHVDLGRQIAALEALVPDTARDLDSLCATCDLDDTAAFNKIARLQVLAAILPKRIEARQNDFLNSARNVGELHANFITYTLGPRVRALRTKAAEEVRKAISQLVSDQFLLSRAVEESDAVHAIKAIYCALNLQVHPEQASAETYRILGSYDLLLEYEKISAIAIKQAGKIGYAEAFARHVEKNHAALQAARDAWQKTAQESLQKADTNPAAK